MGVMTTRTYTELIRLHTFEDRFDYLVLHGDVGRSTFGFDRWINQGFYRSREWKHVRNHVIARDQGCDLGIDDYDIFSRLVIHHMNPMSAGEIVEGDESILDPEFLITTTHRTHNAIHYGNERQLLLSFAERQRGDTKLW